MNKSTELSQKLVSTFLCDKPRENKDIFDQVVNNEVERPKVFGEIANSIVESQSGVDRLKASMLLSFIAESRPLDAQIDEQLIKLFDKLFPTVGWDDVLARNHSLVSDYGVFWVMYFTLAGRPCAGCRLIVSRVRQAATGTPSAQKIASTREKYDAILQQRLESM